MFSGELLPVGGTLPVPDSEAFTLCRNLSPLARAGPAWGWWGL